VLRKTLNLGILAHVDAGKTTLTERLLFAAGVISEIGSVDEGTTQTDSLALERQRGITIKSAVVSFAIGDVTVNLIDTPGHPDFIAEVERALSVLDGAVLVISAVDGVQPQTRILMRALHRLGVPALIFVNKADRRGADYERALAGIAQRLTPAIVPMGTVRGAGTPEATFMPYASGHADHSATLAEVLAEHSELALAAYAGGGPGLSPRRLRAELAVQTGRGNVYPVFFGSALTGAGVDALMSGVAELLPAAAGDASGPVSGRVFKIERGPAGEKIAYARMFSGTVRIRDRVRFGHGGARKVTAISAFAGNRGVRRDHVSAGEIAKLWGLAEIQVGDAVGVPRAAVLAPAPPPRAVLAPAPPPRAVLAPTPPPRAVLAPTPPPRPTTPVHRFAPPTLETVVVPASPGENGALRTALAQLAEQDPLINVRQDDVRQEIYVSLYGEVQKEVIQATLATDFGLDVSFRESVTICVERLIGTGEAVEWLRKPHSASSNPTTPPNPFLATIGLRVEPGVAGTGVTFQIAVELGSMPLAFFRATEDTVRETLQQGLFGWAVPDCVVTMTHSGYLGKHSLGHQRFSKSLSSTGEDYRKLTPLVLMAALRQAGTVVCEPVHHFRLDAPADTLAQVLPALARLHAVPQTQLTGGASAVLEGDIPASQVHGLRQQLPALTRGEGVLECTFNRYEPVSGPPPARPRTGNNPLNRVEYLQRVTRRANLTAR
jgi:ribosomal protection tetracycline resistance protein